MSRRARGRSLVTRLRHPRTTVRWRLTLLYGALFLASGAVLLGVTYTLVAHATVTGSAFVRGPVVEGNQRLKVFPVPGGAHFTVTTPSRAQISPALAQRVKRLVSSPPGKLAVALSRSDQRISDLHQLIIESALALAVMAIIGTALGWIVAGRVLRPLRTMTAATQEISEASLHRRLAMPGPHDELRQLADTIDGLLGRLEGAFAAQRRFVANASHELRTPLTATRALLEMVIGDPRATVETFRTTCRHVLEETDEQEQLIDALLALAQGQRGLDHVEDLDLATVVRAVLPAHELAAGARRLTLTISLAPSPLRGDPRLIERLVSNLMENAIRHNIPGGAVNVRVDGRGAGARLTIANAGPVVPGAQVDRLLQPFQRLARERTGAGDGIGLGLSIVAAVADAHAAILRVAPRPEGGLEIQVRFPAAPGAGGSGGPALGGDERPVRLAGAEPGQQLVQH